MYIGEDGKVAPKRKLMVSISLNELERLKSIEAAARDLEYLAKYEDFTWFDYLQKRKALREALEVKV